MLAVSSRDFLQKLEVIVCIPVHVVSAKQGLDARVRGDRLPLVTTALNWKLLQNEPCTLQGKCCQGIMLVSWAEMYIGQQ